MFHLPFFVFTYLWSNYSMKVIYNKTKFFFFLSLLFFLVATFVFISIPFGNEILFINQFNTPFFDFVFKYITWLGELFWLFIILLFCFHSYKQGLFALLVYIFTTIVAQTIKHIWVEPRPAEYFKDLTKLHFVDGVNIHHWNSFPSGHTTSAFAMAFVLCFILKRNLVLQVGLFLIAFLVGFSRMYLCQHFLKDVIAGAIIGTSVAFGTSLLIQKMNWFNVAKFGNKLINI